MKCHICQQEIIKRIDPNKLKRNKHHFCSRKCYTVFWANERRGKKNCNWNENNQRKCKICSKEFRGSSHKGVPRKFCSSKCYGIYRQEWSKGENNPRWNGGITEIGDKIRHSPEYVIWRNACGRKQRKCQFCFTRKQLIVHHIKTFEKYPELRFEVSNGIVLCRGCHVKLHREHKGVHDFTNILNDYMPNMNNVLKI